MTLTQECNVCLPLAFFSPHISELFFEAARRYDTHTVFTDGALYLSPIANLHGSHSSAHGGDTPAFHDKLGGGVPAIIVIENIMVSMQRALRQD